MESTPPASAPDAPGPETGHPVTLDTRRSARLRSLHPGPMQEDVSLEALGQVIGRDGTQVDLIHTGSDVSRRHAWIGKTDQGAWAIRDLDSLNGVFVNGARIASQQALNAGDVIGLGRARAPDFEFQLTGAADRRRCQLSGDGPWLIGRGTTCDLAVPADLSISERHATIERAGSALRVRDRHSRNGLWQGNQRHSTITLAPGDTFMIGHQRIRWLDRNDDRLTLELSSLGQAIGLQLDQVSIATNDTPDPIELAPGQLHLLQLPQPADRNRLMRSLGFGRLTDGRRFSQGWLAEQPERQRDRIALVGAPVSRPPHLTVRAWLDDEALLRLGAEVTFAERRAVITTTLEALRLHGVVDRRLYQLEPLDAVLCDLAAALLTRPGLLVFDAGSTGLDADRTATLLQRLRPLAGTELTLVVLTPDQGIELRPRLTPNRIRTPLRSLLRRPRLPVLGTLLRRSVSALLRQPPGLAGLVLLPVLLMMLLWFGLELRSAVIVAQAVLLVSAPLAALALLPARDAVPRALIHRFGLLPDQAIAQTLVAGTAVAFQFLLTVGLATVLLPLDVWTLFTGSQVLLSATAGFTLGGLALAVGRSRPVRALLLASLAGTAQAAAVLAMQPGPLLLLGAIILWASLTLLMGAQRRLD